MMIKHKRISVDDTYYFKYNSDVMNECFGTNYNNWFREAMKETYDGCWAWFPKEAIFKDGKYLPGSKDVNWKNILSADGLKLKMYVDPGESVRNDKEKEPRSPEATPKHCFLYSTKYDKQYKYVGTFVTDLISSTDEVHILRRVSDHIELGKDYSYLDFEKTGYPVYENYYLKHDYNKHKTIILDFDAEYNPLDESLLMTQCKSFWEEYSFSQLMKMDEEEFAEIFLKQLSEMLSLILKRKIEASDVYNGERNALLSEIMTLLSVNKPIPDLLRDSKLSEDVAAAILFSQKPEGYIYTISKESVDLYLSKLNIEQSNEDDLIEKKTKLLFWKQVNNLLMDWSVYKYCEFLKEHFEDKQIQIKYIPSPKPTILKRFETEEKQIEDEIAELALNDTPPRFEYLCTPRPREIDSNASKASGQLVVRHIDRRINALIRANYTCEIDSSHPTFIRKNSDKNYTETHHLIPLKYSDRFDNTLDTEENIISLCSNCHNQIHYGEGAEILLRTLYDSRISLLEKAGISKTSDGTEVSFEQLLHMYNI